MTGSIFQHCHKLDGIEEQESVLSQSWKLEVTKQGVHNARLPEGSRKDHILASLFTLVASEGP